MRQIARGFATAGLVVAFAGAPAATPAAEKVHRVVFLSMSEGPTIPTADESFIGVKAALAGAPVELTRESPKKLHAWEELFAGLDKRDVTIALAFVPDGETAILERASQKSKVPLLVLSPESTRPDVEQVHSVFWAGGLYPTDEALFAMDFCLQPLSVHSPVVFHDGSPRAVEAATKCGKTHHVTMTPHPGSLLPETFGVADVKGMVGGSTATNSTQAPSTLGVVDGFVYFGGPAGAERLLAACAGAKTTVPVLVSQGLATRAVPTFAAGAAATAWALEPQYFEDYYEDKGSPCPADLPALTEAAKETGGHLYPATIRGWRAGRWVEEALRRAPETAAKSVEKKFVAALRLLYREAARGKIVFQNWGHACMARTEAWRCPKRIDDPPCTRSKPAYMPMACIPQVGTFVPENFTWDGNKDSAYIWVHWGTPEDKPMPRSIESDLKKLGLNTGGKEAELEKHILDDLIARTMSRCHRLFLRNADGTPIPGVSFNVTYGVEKEPKGTKPGQRYEMIMRGDDPAAGGHAAGHWCDVCTTFIQRTMYSGLALKPALSSSDLPPINGTYKWGSTIEKNMRGETVRALCDGLTQAMSLTGAHENGHMFGLGHDVTTPRSIMNVVEAVGLDFDWAEWIPAHLKTLEQSLGRVPLGTTPSK